MPEHRRIDGRRFAVVYSKRSGDVSITFRILAGDYRLGVKKAVNLINEIFLGFLSLRHPDYMVENFRTPEE